MSAIFFYKVQNRPDYLAYVGKGKEERLVGRIVKIEKDWSVDLNASADRVFFSSAQSAKAFIKGWVLGFEAGERNGRS